MILEQKTLEKLRDLINEETQYRKGHEIVAFFNELGFKDSYGQGFPSRWVYTDEKLKKINGTPEIDKCIKNLLNPVNFIGRFGDLDKCISDFNQYLVFNDWKVVRKGKEINFVKPGKINFDEFNGGIDIKEDDFLNKEFNKISIDKLGLDGMLTEILKLRFDEIKSCLSNNAPLSVIFMCGSTLEGILLGIALLKPKEFNTSKSSPKSSDGKVKPFHEWTLSNLIDVTYEIGMLKEDVRKFSHSLRDFRNYIHPYQQLSSQFTPNKHTALISWQVLKAAIFQLSNNNTQ
jgi:hypothetical protein